MDDQIINSAEQFETIVSQHYEALYRFAMSLTRAEADAQDLTQQTFFVWATKGHQLRDISKVKTWLFTTLHRAFLGTRRRHDRFPHYELDQCSNELPACPPELDQVDSSEVLLALGRVEEVYQAAVALYYLDDCSYAEIAEILEVPTGTVKSRIARGITQLREILLSADPTSLISGVNRSSSIPCANKHAAPPETSSIRRHVQLASAFEPGYEEWDLSSTLLLEPMGGL